MLLEDILLAVAVGIVLLMVGVPIVRSLKVVAWRRKDPLAEAHERLRLAKLEAEVAKVNREAEKIYESLYDETLADDPGAGARIAPDGNAVQVQDEESEKGKKHGQ